MTIPGGTPASRLHIEAAFDPGADYRPVVKLVVDAAAAASPPLSADRLHDLRLAVTEACANAVEVHRPEARGQPVVVRCHADGGEHFHVEVQDRGPGFDDRDAARLPDCTESERLYEESGRGVGLMKQLADDVHFRRVEDGTIVSMDVDPAGDPPQSWSRPRSVTALRRSSRSERSRPVSHPPATLPSSAHAPARSSSDPSA
jgi:anti-sigma regulatory factor (Ser/Thr protein kinase)